MSLEAEIRRHLGPPPQARDWPLVSIVVLNRDGVGLLRRLLGGLSQRTDYPSLELIVVDNGSSDDSLEFIRRVEAPFPISIVSNPHNESFSDACNQGAEIASGELLLFLNNDTEPFEPGWLRELVACLRESGAGAVSSTLVCPDDEHEASFLYGYGVQHRGLTFHEEEGMIHPALRGWEEDPLDERLGEDVECAAVAAACLLIGRDTFSRVGGFSHGYAYGAEDVDLCLELRMAGRSVRCSGRSIVIHHPVSTRRLAPFEEERARKLGNRRLLWERWGPKLRRQYEFDRLDSGEAPAGLDMLGFCFHQAVLGSGEELEVAAADLRRAGHRVLLLQGDRAEDVTGLNYDVAVYVGGSSRYIPKPGQLNVLWVSDPEISPPPIERSRYDLVIVDAADIAAAAENLARETGYRRDFHADYIDVEDRLDTKAD